MFLLGAAPGVAQKAQKNINFKVGREMVVGTHSPSFGFEKKNMLHSSANLPKTSV